MNDDINYRAAYERQKKARELAEQSLEQVSRELYDSHNSLLSAYNELKEQKAQLLHQEKLASIGQLSAGLAHEINNPTAYVLSNLQSVSDYFDNIKQYCDALENIACDASIPKLEVQQHIDACKKKFDLNYLVDDIDGALSDSIEGLERIHTIVTNLKGFARPDSDELGFVCLNECIDNTLKLVQGDLKHKATLNLNLNTIPKISGRQGEISQVILNLLTNAIQAIDKQGQIIIETRADDNYVHMTISDSGKGINASEFNRVFDPFFTTKAPGEGTGLGLTISYGIIQQHNGTMHLTSELGKGSTFHVSLPCIGADSEDT